MTQSPDIARAAPFLAGWRAYAILIVLCLAAMLPGFAALPAMDRDEARFMQATRQMLETGDYVAIRFQNEARNKKPVGIHWLQAMSVRLFGDTADTARWPYRIPSLLGAILAVLLTCAIGTRLFDRRTGFIAAALLGCSLITIVEAHLAKTDAALLAATTAACLALAALYRRPERTKRWAALFWIAIAAGILLKGPITPMIAALAIVTLTIFDRDRDWLRTLAPLWGIPLCAALVLPWMIAIFIQTEGQFFTEALGGDLGNKLVSGHESHGAPPATFLLLAPITLWPASLFLLPAMIHAWRQRGQKPVLFCLAWIVPAWLVFEAIPTKLPHYVLPLYPAVTLLIAAALTSNAAALHARWARWLQGIWVGGVALFGVALIAAAIVFEPRAVVWSTIAALALWIGAGAVIFALRRRDAMRATLFGLGSGVAAIAIMIAAIAPAMSQLWLSARVAAALPRERMPAAVASAGFSEPSLVFMLGTPTLLATDGAAAAAHLDRDQPGAAIIAANQDQAFRDAAAQRNLQIESLERVDGINYSNGRRLRLTIYAVRRNP